MLNIVRNEKNKREIPKLPFIVINNNDIYLVVRTTTYEKEEYTLLGLFDGCIKENLKYKSLEELLDDNELSIVEDAELILGQEHHKRKYI